MNDRTVLLDQWRKVLVFSISAGDSWGFSQLPDAQQFPQRFPIAPEFDGVQSSDDAQRTAAWMLSGVICIAALKLHRYDGDPEFIAGGEPCGWLDLIVHNLRAIDRILPYADDFSTGYMLGLGAALELAMLLPERLPVLFARIDAIGNEDLHRMAIAAVQGLGDENILLDMIDTAVAK
ncbi:MAG: hypothetical protein ABTS16_00435 [Candidatus Accumulibacter phosphatis]|jgi:hypothetical protein|uniref:hypothetical protein n=1 Tax=Candidatus Accumulibacter contiguus TaxID=2954381 RepID=UPI002FC2C29C